MVDLLCTGSVFTDWCHHLLVVLPFHLGEEGGVVDGAVAIGTLQPHLDAFVGQLQERGGHVTGHVTSG